MDELPSSESPESSQPEPESEPMLQPADPEPPEPYIMFEKPKAGTVITSPTHQQPPDDRYTSCPHAEDSQVTGPNENDDAASYYSDR